MIFKDEREFTITGTDENLNGLTSDGERTYHIENALFGETVKIEETYSNRTDTYAKCRSVVGNRNPHRVKSSCPYYTDCGNCHLMHVDYAYGLELKRNLVIRELKPLLNGVAVEACVGVFYPYKTRNKMQLAFTEDRGQLKIGFFSEYSKTIIDIDNCLMHDAWAEKVIKIARNYMEKFKIKPYDEETEDGSIRYLVARAFEDNVMITLVSAKDKNLGLKWLYSELAKNFKKVSLHLNINTSQQSNVFGEKFYYLDGERCVRGSLLGVNFELTPKSFFQTNTKVAGLAYADIARITGELGSKNFIDAYSGIGITSLLMAKQGYNVMSVEIEAQAVLEAKRLAKINNLTIQAEHGDASRILPSFLEAAPDSVVFVDPPRDGLGGAIDPLLKAKPTNILYLSCALYSLKKDLARFVSAGYSITYVKPYDMFCQTRYVECLVCLTRK